MRITRGRYMLLPVSVSLNLFFSSVGQGLARGFHKEGVVNLRIQRILTADDGMIFRASIDPSLIMQWFPYNAHVYWRLAPAGQMRVGREFAWTVVGNSDESRVFSFHGIYRELKPAKKLVFIWNWNTMPFPGIEEPGSTVVTVEFVSQGQNTLLILTQSGFTTDVSGNAHEKGWNRCLDGMELVLRGKRWAQRIWEKGSRGCCFSGRLCSLGRASQVGIH